MIKDEAMIVNGQDTGEGKWSQHPELLRAVTFRKINEGIDLYIANVENSIWKIKLNNFPDEPIYTICIDEKSVMSFNDWPDEVWKVKEY